MKLMKRGKLLLALIILSVFLILGSIFKINNYKDKFIIEYYDELQANLPDFYGTELVSDPYIIKAENDINTLRTLVNSGMNFQGLYFIVESNASFTFTDYQPIGTTARPFYGSFDGNFTQFNLTINNSSLQQQALFSYYGIGTIKNLSVAGSIFGGTSTGLIVGEMISGRIENVYN